MRVHGEELAIPYDSIAEAFDKVIFYGEVSGLTAFEDQEDSGGGLAEEEEGAEDDSILGAVFNFSDTTTEQYTARMETVQAQATESYQAISRFLSGEELLSLQEAYDALMVTKDANFIAFSHLSPESPNFASAVIAMLLAILVDGWTMVLARLKNRSEASPLYARGSEDFFEEEVDLMETVFMSIHQNPSAGVSVEEGDFAGYCTAYLNSIVSVIYNYLDKFQISNCTVHQGYGAYVFAEEIDGSCFRPITSILMKFNYMVSLSEWEYLQLRREWGEAEPAGASRLSEHSQGRTVYLLRSKAEIYLRQNIAKSNLLHTMMREFENWEVQHE